jgi:hypothetical protein
MSISPLAVEALPRAGRDVRALVEALERALDDGADVSWFEVADSDLLDLVARLGRAGSRLSAVRLGGVAETERRQAARRVGARSTGSWLQGQGMRAGAAHREVALAGALGELAATREALGTGAITPDHAQVVAATMQALSDEVDDAGRARAERSLLDRAERMDPTRLAKEAPGVARRVDPHAAARLAARERDAKDRRHLALTRTHDGAVALSGLLDPEGAATLSAALDPLAAPAPSTADGPDPRRPGQRLADALVELARRSLHHGGGGRLPDAGGDRPQLVVTMTLDQLRAGHDAVVRLDGGLVGEPLSGAAARRIACDAQVIPAVLGGDSEILDLGRGRRTASAAQRRALRLRDGGCVGEGCDRPPAWCEPHHIVHWADGGPTDIGNLVLLCTTHHELVHHGGWTVRFTGSRAAMHPPRAATGAGPPGEP